MRRFLLAAACIAVLGAVVPGIAAAAIDTTNTNFRSNITRDPRVPGLSLSILDYNDELVLRNHSGREVTVLGYSNEPYGRVLADGTVEVNKASPAYYLNQNFYGNVTVPPSASAGAPPQWTTLDRSGTFQWHDHRIHWMSPVTPPQVKDKNKVTKIFDWQVPLRIGAQPALIYGNLFWVGRKGGGFPTWALAALIVFVIVGLGFAWRLQRRRIAVDEASSATDSPGDAAREAW